MSPLNKPHHFDPVILREYDIRGQVGLNLSNQDAYALGLSFGTFTQHETQQTAPLVCVGYDGRHSSPDFSDHLIRGLLESGCNVQLIGIGPTPMLYYSVKHLNADAGIMITGSHNPSDYNGFKMTLQCGPIFGERIQEIGQIAATGNYNRGLGKLSTLDIKDAYISRLMQDFTGGRGLKIAWDAGNGAAGEVLRLLTDKLPGEHILLYDEIDGDFPNHHPDPTVDKNLIDLQKTVLEDNCDLGIAFDGDGDRIGVVDERGRVIRCDILLTIYAREVLANHPGAPIIGDVKCSQVMFDEIAHLGGQPVMWKTGHSLIKDKINETGAPLAGELSGHIFFADKYYGFDDALYCAIRLLNDVCDSHGALSSLTQDLPHLYDTPEIRIEVKREEKFELLPKLIKSIKPKLSDDMIINDIDGMRVSNGKGWWLLRPSNTQDVLVFRAEAKSEQELRDIQAMISDEISALGYHIDFS